MYKQALRTFAVLFTVSLSHQVIAQIIPNRQTKEADVRALISQFAEVRNAHDGNAVAALYTTDGEWLQNEGTARVYGRPNLAKWWGSLTGHVDRKISSIEFPGTDIAVVHVILQEEGHNEQHSEVFILIDTLLDTWINKSGHGWRIKIHQTLQ